MAKYSIVTALTWSSSIYTWLHGAVCVCWNFLLPRPLWSPQSLCTLLQLPAWLTSTYFTLSCCILLIATADTADTAGTAITSLTKQPYFIEHTLHISFHDMLVSVNRVQKNAYHMPVTASCVCVHTSCFWDSWRGETFGHQILPIGRVLLVVYYSKLSFVVTQCNASRFHSISPPQGVLFLLWQVRHVTIVSYAT